MLKLVEATPEARSEAVKATVTARLCQRPSAPVCVVTGGIRSIRTGQVLASSMLPALSCER